MNFNTTDTRPLNLGFIGGSIQSAVGQTHCIASQIDNRWKLKSGCFSRNKTINISTAQQWNIPESKVYSNWKDYIDKEKNNVDAIVVLTPTPEHHQIVCYLLDNAIPVICEKAMAADLEQSATIKQSISKNKGFLAVTFNYSGYPMIRDLRQHIKNGKLGKLQQIQIEMPSDGFIQEKNKMSPQPWRLSDGKIPTLLLDLAVHLHHLTFFLTSLKPVSINSDFHHFSIFDDIIDDAYMWVNYEKDFHSSLWVSKTALGHRNGLKLRIFGDIASAEWLQEDPEKLHIYSKNSTRTTYDRGNTLFPDEIRERFKPGHPSGFIEAFANLYSDIADSIINFQNKNHHSKSPYVFGWDHANEGLEMFYAATKANNKREWVNIKSVSCGGA